MLSVPPPFSQARCASNVLGQSLLKLETVEPSEPAASCRLMEL